jgi:enamine deaminase RidA (YjgF/YER057c/UK114 family)
MQLARIWHYVPAINSNDNAGLETYRSFSRGRSLAFEHEFGTRFHSEVPAASAVGTDSANLTIVFAATRQSVRHLENPLQLPAYAYPAEHGPRAPSFARASVVADNDGQADVFISGTAAIRGHASVAPGDTPAQLECTIENLRTISGSCGMGGDLSRGRSSKRHFKVYLRNADDLATVRTYLERELTEPSDSVIYLRSDICRRELNIEIEATLLGVRIG